jgi:hypothetical protein
MALVTLYTKQVQAHFRLEYLVTINEEWYTGAKTETICWKLWHFVHYICSNSGGKRLSCFRPIKLKQMRYFWVLSAELAHLPSSSCRGNRELIQPSRQKRAQGKSLTHSAKTLHWKFSGPKDLFYLRMNKTKTYQVI